LLNLSKINRTHWQIFDVSAISGQGLDLTINWIITEFASLQKKKETTVEGL